MESRVAQPLLLVRRWLTERLWGTFSDGCYTRSPIPLFQVLGPQELVGYRGARSRAMRPQQRSYPLETTGGTQCSTVRAVQFDGQVLNTMTHDEPACTAEKLSPCSPSDWVQCDRCGQMVCEVHNALFEVRHSGDAAYNKVDRLCQQCIDGCWEQGELISGDTAQYINVR